MIWREFVLIDIKVEHVMGIEAIFEIINNDSNNENYNDNLSAW